MVTLYRAIDLYSDFLYSRSQTFPLVHAEQVCPEAVADERVCPGARLGRGPLPAGQLDQPGW